MSPWTFCICRSQINSWGVEMALWTFGIVNTLLCLFSQYFQTAILHFLVPSSFAQAPCGQYLAFFSAPPINCVLYTDNFVPDLPFPLLQLPKTPDGLMAFIDSLKRYSDIHPSVVFLCCWAFFLGHLISDYQRLWHLGYNQPLGRAWWPSSVACRLCMEEFICVVFRSVITPLATVKSLFRSPCGSRPGTF